MTSGPGLKTRTCKRQVQPIGVLWNLSLDNLLPILYIISGWKGVLSNSMTVSLTWRHIGGKCRTGVLFVDVGAESGRVRGT